MLILTRSKRKTELIINTTDGPILIRVLEIVGSQVRLGIEAPANCAIARAELLSTEGTTTERKELPCNGPSFPTRRVASKSSSADDGQRD